MRLNLVAVAGPQSLEFRLEPGPPYSIGRRPSHAISLEHPEVSKNHALLAHRDNASGGGWFIVDTNSRHGTRVNGVPLQPQRECPVMPGDLIEISPWTFCVMAQADSATHGSRVSTVDDTHRAGSTVTSIQVTAGRELAQERLRLLLRCAEALSQAHDEANLADIVLTAAVAGTGYMHAGLTRPMTPDGEIELIAGRGDVSGRDRTPRLSRSLIKAASSGTPVQLLGSGTPIMQEAVSIAEYGIHDAICVPLMVESTVAGFLYLDNRGSVPGGTIGASEACAFAVGIGRLASMAWANLKRLDLERRFARMEGEVSAAARLQQMILPPREGCRGDIAYIGECRAGRMISGDFFDVFEIGEGRVAVTIGDVSGKGVPAAVMMTTAHGYVHGALRQHGDLVRTMRDLNLYVYERCGGQTFATLWAGIFDTARGTLTYVDAGHGYAWLLRENADGTSKAETLDAEGGPPIGVMPESNYAAATIALSRGDRAMLVSDGIIEQPAAGRDRFHDDDFGRRRVETALQNSRSAVDEVAALFDAVNAHAGGGELADDATVVLAQWSPSSTEMSPHPAISSP